MSRAQWSTAVLRVFGDDLDPDEISALLGCRPSSSARKGDRQVIGTAGRVRILKTGRWSLQAADSRPEDVEAQIFAILDRLTADMAVWRSLGERYQVDMFCGLFMDSGNDNLLLSSKALLALGQRGIELELDIYDPIEDESAEPH